VLTGHHAPPPLLRRAHCSSLLHLPHCHHWHTPGTVPRPPLAPNTSWYLDSRHDDICPRFKRESVGVSTLGRQYHTLAPNASRWLS
jgi:hypothetical protein